MELHIRVKQYGGKNEIADSFICLCLISINQKPAIYNHSSGKTD